MCIPFETPVRLELLTALYSPSSNYVKSHQKGKESYISTNGWSSNICPNGKKLFESIIFQPKNILSFVIIRKEESILDFGEAIFHPSDA